MRTREHHCMPRWETVCCSSIPEARCSLAEPVLLCATTSRSLAVLFWSRLHLTFASGVKQVQRCSVVIPNSAGKKYLLSTITWVFHPRHLWDERYHTHYLVPHSTRRPTTPVGITLSILHALAVTVSTLGPEQFSLPGLTHFMTKQVDSFGSQTLFRAVELKCRTLS